MNEPSFSFPRLFRRTKQSRDMIPERVSGVYLQEQLMGAVPGSQVNDAGLTAESVLSEYRLGASDEPAASPLFIP